MERVQRSITEKLNSDVPIATQFDHYPHHNEYSYTGYEPTQPNYISYIYDDGYPLDVPYQDRQQEYQKYEGPRSIFDDKKEFRTPAGPATHLDYFMNLDHYDINVPDVSTADQSWEPIDDFFLSILDRYTRFWRRYRKGTEFEEPINEEVKADQEVEKSDEILKNVDEKFKTIDKLFDENQPANLSKTISDLDNIISQV